MENAEEIFQFLEEFSKRKPKIIPQELNDYLVYVARTGDPVYQWSLVKCLFKEKLVNVITDFHESTPSVEIPHCPNVDPFNYDLMKNSLLERLDTFTSAPFTVQRICELLTCPRKQYNRVDKFMRAIEKNILVVSTREPGLQRQQEQENGEPMEAMVNGTDKNSDYNVDVEMEDMSWKEAGESKREPEPQPSSSDAHISVDDLEARLQAKHEEVGHEKPTTDYESVTPPELNVTDNTDESQEQKIHEKSAHSISPVEETKNVVTDPTPEPKIDIEMNDNATDAQPERILVIPDIKVDDADMTEQKLQEQAADILETEPKESLKAVNEVPEVAAEELSGSTDVEKSSDENISNVNLKDETEPKNISEVSSSSEESSSSENTDGNSNSPKQEIEEDKPALIEQKDGDPVQSVPNVIPSENYSITDVDSELPVQEKAEDLPEKPEEIKHEVISDKTVDVPLNTETTAS